MLIRQARLLRYHHARQTRLHMPISSRNVAALTGPSPAPETAERVPLDMIAVNAMHGLKIYVRRDKDPAIALLHGTN